MSEENASVVRDAVELVLQYVNGLSSRALGCIITQRRLQDAGICLSDEEIQAVIEDLDKRIENAHVSLGAKNPDSNIVVMMVGTYISAY